MEGQDVCREKYVMGILINFTKALDHSASSLSGLRLTSAAASISGSRRAQRAEGLPRVQSVALCGRESGLEYSDSGTERRQYRGTWTSGAVAGIEPSRTVLPI